MNDRTTLETYFDLNQDLDIEVETAYIEGQKIVTIRAYNLFGKKVFEALAHHQHTYIKED